MTFLPMLKLRRFQAIDSYNFHLNNVSKMPKQDDPNFDVMYRIRPLIDSSRKLFQKAYTLGRELSVDEGMIAYHGIIGYLQYIPKKPTRFSIKVWLLAELKTAYLPKYIVYISRLSEENQNPLVETENPGYKVVMTLMTPFLDLGHHVYFDNLFTSLKLMEDLRDPPL